MTILRNVAESVLYQALKARVGIEVLVLEEQTGVITPSLRAKQILYRYRKELGDAELLKLQIRLSPTDPDHRLWIIKGTPDDA